MGVYYLSQGDVQKAINSFGDAKTNNAALAHILARNYTTAQEILAKVAAPDATTSYLKAIVAARTNNESGVLSNLRDAAKADSALLARAKSDLEFANFNLSNL